MNLTRTIKWLLFSFFVVTLSACYPYPISGGIIIGDNHGRYRDHHPGYGLRSYWYYPDVEVYFDIGSSLYFYFYESRWRSAKQLPRHYSKKLGNRVPIKMESDKPYKHHGEHRKKYKKGHGQYKEKHKNNGKNKGGWRGY